MNSKKQHKDLTSEEIGESQIIDEKKNTFSSIDKENYDQYMKAISTAVDIMMVQDPESYKKAQLLGEHTMSCDYDLQIGVDLKGDRIRAELIKRDIEEYGLLLSELSESEQRLYNSFFGEMN
jgi:hypothetical protein